MKRRLLSTGLFSREIGWSPQKTRNLVRDGVLDPERLSDGSFVFSDDHVAIARSLKKPGRRPKDREGGA